MQIEIQDVLQQRKSVGGHANTSTSRSPATAGQNDFEALIDPVH